MKDKGINMNNGTNYQQMIEQPLPAQFEEEVSGGCQPGGLLAIFILFAVLVAVMLVMEK